MSRLGLAFRAFFAVLSGRIAAPQLRSLLAGEPPAEPEQTPAAPQPRPAPTTRAADGAGRSEAITLLATLQREARFVDLVQEPLGNYSDQQIGAAARDVLRDCREVLTRMFALQPIVDAAEEEWIEAPEGESVGRLRLTGTAAGEPARRGKLVHHGWEATRCELPAWSGDERSKQVVAPAEIECA